MERLQAAIEKARAQRDSAAPATSPNAQAAPEAAHPAWMALTPIEIRRKSFTRNRLVAFEGGRDAAPYDMLRTRLLHQAVSHGWRRIAIVSPHSACGKTTTAANLAFTLARQSDIRSLILDLDLRRGGLAKVLAQRCESSMADVLDGSLSFAEHGRRFGENVALGFSEGHVGNPSELLQSKRAREALNRIEAEYAPDLVLFDMPPLMASDDNFGFLTNVDCVLLFVAAEETSMDAIDVAERQLSELTNVMGIVLNKCRYTDGGAYGTEYEYY